MSLHRKIIEGVATEGEEGTRDVFQLLTTEDTPATSFDPNADVNAEQKHNTATISGFEFGTDQIGISFPFEQNSLGVRVEFVESDIVGGEPSLRVQWKEKQEVTEVLDDDGNVYYREFDHTDDTGVQNLTLNIEGLTREIWEEAGGGSTANTSSGPHIFNSLFTLEKPDQVDLFEAAGLTEEFASLIGITEDDLRGEVAEIDTYDFA